MSTAKKFKILTTAIGGMALILFIIDWYNDVKVSAGFPAAFLAALLLEDINSLISKD